MTITTPLADLIQNRMDEPGLSPEALGRRLGYANATKAVGRVYALCNGQPLSAKSRSTLLRLPQALEASPEAVKRAAVATEQLLAEAEQEADEQRRRAREVEDAAWKAAFLPHAVILTEHTSPTQITVCGLTGGAEQWLMLPLDADRPPITFIAQAVAAVRRRYDVPVDGSFTVPFFGNALGLIVNYAPNRAIRCDLSGHPLEALSKAYRIGEVSLSFGGRPASPSAVAALLGA